MNLQFSDGLLGELLMRILIIVLFITALWILRGIVSRLLIGPLRRYAERTTTQWDNVLIDVVDAAIRYLVVTLALYGTLRLLFPGSTAFDDHLARSLIVLIVFVTLFNTI